MTGIKRTPTQSKLCNLPTTLRSFKNHQSISSKGTAVSLYVKGCCSNELFRAEKNNFHLLSSLEEPCVNYTRARALLSIKDGDVFGQGEIC